MDPRPYNYEYRKPRFSNPTLYPFSNLANLAISTKVSTILARFKNSTPTMIKLITIAPLTMGLPWLGKEPTSLPVISLEILILMLTICPSLSAAMRSTGEENPNDSHRIQIEDKVVNSKAINHPKENPLATTNTERIIMSSQETTTKIRDTVASKTETATNHPEIVKGIRAISEEDMSSLHNHEDNNLGIMSLKSNHNPRKEAILRIRKPPASRKEAMSRAICPIMGAD